MAGLTFESDYINIALLMAFNLENQPLLHHDNILKLLNLENQPLLHYDNIAFWNCWNRIINFLRNWATQFSQEWARRKVVVKHSIKSNLRNWVIK